MVAYEILSRTSPETVAKCRAVCKTWNKATYGSAFTDLLNDRTKTVSGFFVQTPKKFYYSITFVAMNNNNSDQSSKLSLGFLHRKKVKIEAAAKPGILLCLSHDNAIKPRVPEYIICKPTTQQWKKLPNPRTRFFTLKTSIAVLGSNPFRYKIVRFSQPKQPLGNTRYPLYYSFYCEIFDSTTWVWKRLTENVKLPFWESLDSLKPAVSASGFLFALTTERRFVAFDWEKESWEVFGLPQPLCDNDYCKQNNMQVTEYEGRLALMCMVEDDCMELWVMEDCSKKTWSFKKKVVIKSEDYNFIFPVALCNTDVALMNACFEFVFCNFQGSALKEFKVRNTLWPASEEFFRI